MHGTHSEHDGISSGLLRLDESSLRWIKSFYGRLCYLGKSDNSGRHTKPAFLYHCKTFLTYYCQSLHVWCQRNQNRNLKKIAAVSSAFLLQSMQSFPSVSVSVTGSVILCLSSDVHLSISRSHTLNVTHCYLFSQVLFFLLSVLTCIQL